MRRYPQARITGEIADWQGHAPEAIQAIKSGLERHKQLGVEAIDD
jgi:rifampin ADP-ribosylating transferase